MTMYRINIMCGIPGSGKSTFVEKEFGYLPDWTIVESDKITKKHLEIAGYPNANHPSEVEEIEEPHVFMIDVWQDIYVYLKDLMETGFTNIVLDATNVNHRHLMNLIELIEEYEDYEWKVIAMSTPFHTCLERNENREKRVPKEILENMYLDYLETVSMLISDFPNKIINSAQLEL